jgi:dTDP-4-amino-4,6-dideoxygalactose transaminase
MGEGGAVTTRDSNLTQHMALLRTHGITRDPAQFKNPDMAYDEGGTLNPWYMEMIELGFNYRAPDINCALGTSQLSKLPRFLSRRRYLSDRYIAALAGMNEPIRPITAPKGVNPGWHLFRVRINFQALGQSRAKLMADLRAAGIGSQVHYIPVNRHPYYEARYGKHPLLGADAHYAQILSLPLFPDMTDEDVDATVSALRRILA